METTVVYWGYIGIMEKKMETTIVCRGCIGTTEKNMKTTRIGYIGLKDYIGYNKLETWLYRV